MTDTPSRLFGLLCVLVGIWVVTYWLYQPAAPKVTRDSRPPVSQARSAPASSGSPPPLISLVTPPTPPARPEPATQTPATPPLTHKVKKVIPPEFREYTVQAGDSGWEAIAARREVYGDRRLWQSVARANPWVTSDRLKPGKTVLKIPIDPTNIQGKVVEVDEVAGPGNAPQPPAPDPARSKPSSAAPGAASRYTIQPDDTLWSIAKKVYGKGAEWKKIYEANKDLIPDPDRPPQGVSIRIPPASPGA